MPNNSYQGGERERGFARSDFATLWAENYSRLRAYVRIFVPSLEDSEDVLQETAVAIAKDFERYDPARPFLDWAVAIARNRIREHYRARQRDRKMVFGEEAARLIEDSFVSRQPQFDAYLEALEGCLKSLPAKSMRLIELRYLSCLKADDMAEQTGLTVQSVYSRLTQIRKSLLECVQRKLGLQGDIA